MSDAETVKEPVEKRKVLTEKQLANLQRMREQKAIKRKAEEMLKERERTQHVPAEVSAPAPAPATPPAPQEPAAFPAKTTPAPAAAPSHVVDPEVYELKEYLKAYMRYKDQKKKLKKEMGGNGPAEFYHDDASRYSSAGDASRYSSAGDASRYSSAGDASRYSISPTETYMPFQFKRR